MADVSSFKKVKAALDKRAAVAGKQSCTYVVGYTAKYAIYVHERVEMKWKGLPRRGSNGRPGRGRYWDPQGRAQAKFLEAPARRLQPDFARMVRSLVSSGKTLDQAILVIALRLQRESQILVPIDTGNLRASAFTKRES